MLHSDPRRKDNIGTKKTSVGQMKKFEANKRAQLLAKRRSAEIFSDARNPAVDKTNIKIDVLPVKMKKNFGRIDLGKVSARLIQRVENKSYLQFTVVNLKDTCSTESAPGNDCKDSKGVDDPVRQLYQNLLENQQPLGEKLQKVLIENLWDLYTN